MSRSALFDGVFGDGRHPFRLRIGELEELQEKCDAGPEEIYWRLQTGAWRVADIRETLRLGLIGGGLTPTPALVLVNRYAGEGWLAEWKALAANIIAAALFGAPDEDKPAPAPGEAEGETATSPDEKSGSPTSTQTGPSFS
ncbi:MAG: gene transfer agent family protein [Caulobacter sp.]|nr:gene transfer agent family protein [Caulobacter sp.]